MIGWRGKGSRLNFERQTAVPNRSCRMQTAISERPAAKRCSTTRNWRNKDWILWRRLFRRRSRATHRMRRRFLWSCWRRKADNFLNSTFTNLPGMQAMEETGLLEMQPGDAEARGIADGDAVRVFNNRGEIQLKAKVDGKVSPGVVAAKLNWAKLTPGGANINVLTSEKLTDMGNSATFYSVLVEVGAFSARYESEAISFSPIDDGGILDALHSSTV